jgi:hypothetical protein
MQTQRKRQAIATREDAVTERPVSIQHSAPPHPFRRLGVETVMLALQLRDALSQRLGRRLAQGPDAIKGAAAGRFDGPPLSRAE